MNRYWCRFFVKFADMRAFEYHGPWWESGFDDERAIICAAVCAPDSDAAQKVIEAAFDEGHTFDSWDGATRRAADWAPFCERFARAKWMLWPWPGEDGKPRPAAQEVGNG